MNIKKTKTPEKPKNDDITIINDRYQTQKEKIMLQQDIEINDQTYQALVSCLTGIIKKSYPSIQDIDREDIIHTTIEKVLKSSHTFKEWSKYTTRIFAICANNCRDYLIQKQKKQSVSITWDLIKLLSNWDDSNLKDKKDALQTAINHLSFDDQDLIRKYYYDNNNLQDIAEDRGTSVDSIKRKLYTIRNKLKKMVNKDNI
jgi:RNA polymerase sigma factor (sigma-70 family)